MMMSLFFQICLLLLLFETSHRFLGPVELMGSFGWCYCLKTLQLTYIMSVSIKLEKKLERSTFAASIYLFKFNNKNTRKRCGISSKLTIKTLE